MPAFVQRAQYIHPFWLPVPMPSRLQKLATRTAVAACGGLAAYCSSHPIPCGLMAACVSLPGAGLMGAGYGVIKAVENMYNNSIAASLCTVGVSLFFGWYSCKNDFIFGVADRRGY